MDFRQLRHFMVLAEELHFGRAARRLGIAQPPLSQSIKRLEADLGMDLFDRSSRRVSLTAAGQAFLPDVRSALAQLEIGAQHALRVARGEMAEIDVGFTSTALFQALPKLLRLAQDIVPVVHLKLVEQSSVEQIESLRAGRLDLALIHPGPPHMLDGLATCVIERSKTIAVIPADWPLARKTSVKLHDLADCDFIMPPLYHGTYSIAPLIAACEAAGFTPRVRQEASQTSTMLSLSAAGFGVSLLPESAISTGRTDVRFLPITDMPDHLQMQIVAAWLPESCSPPLAALVDALESV